MTASFTITQTPLANKLFLYPDADSMTGMLPIGEASNYQCVDEDYDIPDEDATYVYTKSVSIVTDIYRLPNHTSETGAINYVQVFARAKSHLCAQDGTGIYKISVSTSAATYSSDDINLSSDYTTYSNVWVENPDTSTAWTWVDIDALKIGVAASSPSVAGAATNLTLRPNAAGDITQLRDGSTGVHVNYEDVDEATPNEDTDFVYIDGGLDVSGFEYYDLYNLENHTSEIGTINYVDVFNRGRKNVSGGISQINQKIKIGGVVYTGSSGWNTNIQTYFNFTDRWTSNPSTLAAWTWANIDSLQAGVGLRYWNFYSGQQGRCTQNYVVVNYNAINFNPEIRTTQCYAVVNYAASSTTCFLSKPYSYTYSNNRQVNKFNTWNGERKVYDVTRTSKMLIMTGIEYPRPDSVVTTTLNCVRAMKDNGTYITISGMNDTLVDTTWMIQDFNFVKNAGNPNIYDWVLTLERYENV